MNTEYSDKALDILTAARDLFIQKGFSGTTTKEIARAAGVNEVTVFRCFESKAKLFQAVHLHFYFEPDYSQFENYQAADLKEYLVFVGRFFQKIFDRNINVILIELKEHPMPETKALVDEYLRDLYEKMIHQVSALTPCTLQEAKTFSFTFLCSLYGLFINLYVFNPFKIDLDFDACLEKLVDAFTHSGGPTRTIA